MDKEGNNYDHQDQCRDAPMKAAAVLLSTAMTRSLSAPPREWVYRAATSEGGVNCRRARRNKGWFSIF